MAGAGVVLIACVVIAMTAVVLGITEVVIGTTAALAVPPDIPAPHVTPPPQHTLVTSSLHEGGSHGVHKDPEW